MTMPPLRGAVHASTAVLATTPAPVAAAAMLCDPSTAVPVLVIGFSDLPAVVCTAAAPLLTMMPAARRHSHLSSDVVRPLG